MTKYAPGPWRIVSPSIIDAWQIISTKAGRCVATIPRMLGDTGAKPPADAKLIAAAPDLLEALEGVLDNAIYDDAFSVNCIDAIAQAHTAINKALGND